MYTIDNNDRQLIQVLMKDLSMEKYSNWKGDAVISGEVRMTEIELYQSLKALKTVGYLLQLPVSDKTDMDEYLYQVSNKFINDYPEEMI